MGLIPRSSAAVIDTSFRGLKNTMELCSGWDFLLNDEEHSYFTMDSVQTRLSFEDALYFSTTITTLLLLKQLSWKKKIKNKV